MKVTMTFIEPEKLKRLNLIQSAKNEFKNNDVHVPLKKRDK